MKALWLSCSDCRWYELQVVHMRSPVKARQAPQGIPSRLQPSRLAPAAATSRPCSADTLHDADEPLVCPRINFKVDVDIVSGQRHPGRCQQTAVMACPPGADRERAEPLIRRPAHTWMHGGMTASITRMLSAVQRIRACAYGQRMVSLIACVLCGVAQPLVLASIRYW